MGNKCITYILPLFLENLSHNFQINPFIADALKISVFL